VILSIRATKMIAVLPIYPFAAEALSRRRRILVSAVRKIIFLLALAAVLFLGNAFAAERQEAAPADGVLRGTLENGLRVVIVRNTLAPTVATVVNYSVGSSEAPEGFPGMAHALEHMMFRGSPELSADQLADIIAAMGGTFDADTQQTVTQYFFVAPADDLDVALHLEAIRMRGILVSEGLWAQERGAIEQEVAQDLSSPEFVFYTRLLAAMFKGTPYAHTPLGTVTSFDKTTGAMLKKFHETWYAPNNAVLVIVGDVEPRKAFAEVERYFGDIPSREIPHHPQVRLQPVKPQTIRLKTDESSGLAIIGFLMPGYDSPDYAACRVLADVLSNQRSNLFALVPAGKALYAEFSLDALPKAGIGYAVAAFPRGADAEALVKEMRKIVMEDVKKGLPIELVEAAKLAWRTKAELQKNSVLGLAMAWSDALTVEGKDSPEATARAVEQVSVEDVNRVARKYLNLEQAIVTILTPASSGKPVASKSRGQGAESLVPVHTKPSLLPPWADKALGRLEIPHSTVHPVVTTLPNGLTLIVQPESVSDTVSVYGHVKNSPGMETPKGKEGVEQVLEQLFPYGTTTLDRVAFQKALDEIGAHESAGSDFSIQVLSGHFERAVQLLADNQLRPALPGEAFAIVQRQVAATIAGQLQSPHYLAKRALRVGLFPQEDPTLREATPVSVSSLSHQDVLDYYGATFRPDLTTIVVMGKVTPEQARTVIERYFGPWKATGPKPDTNLPPVPANKPLAFAVPNTSRIQDEVTLAQTLGLVRSNPDYYALELGNHVLGGAFYATRLYRDLREETGLVYYVSSSFTVGLKRSLYVATYGCDPANVAKARAIVERNLREMQTTPVTAAELRQAKALLLREIPLSESSVDDIAQKLIDRATHDLPLDESTRAARRYLNLTAEEVRAAYAAWLRPGDLVQVVEGPPPQ
jgi:zinc protease